MEWHRVNRQRPCSVCGKGDWCTYSDFGAGCMRIESPKPLKNGGWLHLSGDADRKAIVRYKRTTDVGSTPTPAHNFKALLTAWRFNRSNPAAMDHLSNELNVPHSILEDLGICYSDYYHAYAFPMSVASGEVVGIRLRNTEHKWSVKGSHSALFIPWNAIGKLPAQTTMICEGPTDTAAAMKLGFFAIGRPACLGCEAMVAQVIHDLGATEAILCYDNDEPGVRGANKLAEAIPCRVIRFVPPSKDLRQFVANGGNRELILSMIGNTIRT